MPLKPGSSEKTISRDIREMSKPYDRDVDAAMKEARETKKLVAKRHPAISIPRSRFRAFAQGGEAGLEPQDAPGGFLPGITKPRGPRSLQQPQQPLKLHVGPIHSAVAGRTDHIPTHVPSDSYVVPADIVSGMGEGNTKAGFRHLRGMFTELRRRYGGLPYSGDSAPYGQHGGPYGGHARGGKTDGVPVVLSGGEHVLTPDEVRAAGEGDMDAGHKALDEFVKQYRAKLVKTLKALPGPRRD